MSDQAGETGYESGQLRRSGSVIHYWVRGPEDGPLVACIHGASMDDRMFDPQVQPLTATGYRALT